MAEAAQEQGQQDQGAQQFPRALTCENFLGVNTATTRAGVDERQTYWMDGFIPLSPRNARALWGIGSALYSLTAGAVLGLGVITPGGGGSGGPFTNVPLTGGHGSGAQATITLSVGGVSTAIVTARGAGYVVGDVLSAAPANIGGTTGFSVPVATVNAIVCFYFYNLGAAPYVVIFLADGSAVQVNTATSAVTTILPSGTIVNPSITTLGISQWGSQYLLIVSVQPNGYWIWDGSLLYTAGTLAPGVTLTNVGNGYHSPPVVTATGGFGSGATFSATVANGIVTGVTITNPGHGYLAGDAPTLVFTGGTQAGSGAILTAVLTHFPGGSGASFTMHFTYDGSRGAYAFYTLTSITINSGGSGYGALATPVLSAGSGFWPDGVPTLTFTNSGGVITAVNINAPPGGALYQTASPFTLPTLTVTDSGYYYVSSVVISNGGTGYSPATTIVASGGGTPYAQATIVPTIVGGVITGTTITSPGYYGSNAAPALTVTDTSVTASAVISLAPYGISGNAVATFQGHVWVFNGNVFNFSAPGSVTNFATSAGGGSDQSSVNYLKVGYTQAVSTNGFLFLIGDSSMDYISGVTTATPTGGAPTTTFTQNNSDPEIGTPYPAAVTTLGQEILIANSAGVFVSSGGEFTKRSEMLDGIFNTVPATNFNANPFNGFQLSTAKATIFGKRVWMMLVPIVDPVSNNQVNKLLMFRDDGKIWWASQQDVVLTFIAGQEINSIFTAWGTDGTSLYPLFNQPSVNFTKLVQTKYWDTPGGYDYNKAVSRFWSIWDYFSMSAPNITLTVDAVGIDGGGTQYTNSNTYTIAGPTATGYFCTQPGAVGQQGILNGFTIETNAADVALISAMVQPDEPVGYRG